MHMKKPSQNRVNERGIYVGYTPPLRTILIFDIVLQNKKKIFASVIKIIPGIYGQNSSYFKWVEGGFRGTPKGGCTPPHKSRGVFYTHIGHGN